MTYPLQAIRVQSLIVLAKAPIPFGRLRLAIPLNLALFGTGLRSSDPPIRNYRFSLSAVSLKHEVPI